MRKANKIIVALLLTVLVLTCSIIISDNINLKRQEEDKINEQKKKEAEDNKEGDNKQGDNKEEDKKEIFKEDPVVNVNGKNMQAYIRGSGEYTFVLLPGFVTKSPMENFQILTDELSKNHRTVVIDPLGYGLSDDTDEPRTVENMTAEIHAVLNSLNIKEYALVAHSIWGVYALDYINTYPNEVKMHIGIDSTLPAWGGAEEGEVFAKESLDKANESSGSFVSKGMISEGREMMNNFNKTKNLRYPENLPVLYLLADESVESNYFWYQVHEDMLVGVNKGKIEILKGSHYLHSNDSPGIVEKIENFIKELDS